MFISSDLKSHPQFFLLKGELRKPKDFFFFPFLFWFSLLFYDRNLTQPHLLKFYLLESVKVVGYEATFLY